MDKMPQWADIVLIPLISLILAAVLSALGIGFNPDNVFANMAHGFMYFLPIYVVTLLAGGFWMGIPSIASMIAPFLLAQAGAVIAYSGMSALAGLLPRFNQFGPHKMCSWALYHNGAVFDYRA